MSKAVPNKLDVPKDQSNAEKIASPIASLSSHADPVPYYIASGLCAGAAGALHQLKNNSKAAAAAAGFSLLYLSAGRLVITGNPRLGYDLGSLTSLGLVAWAAPGVSYSGANAVLATVGGVSAVPNLIKSYELRTGRPKEMVEH